MGEVQIMKKGHRRWLKPRRTAYKQNVLFPDDESQNLIAVALVFFAIASVIGGGIILAVLWRNNGLTDYWFFAVLGVLLLAAGLTVLWTMSALYRH